MSHPEDSPRLTFVPEDELELGQLYSGQVNAVINGYWAVHPERGLVVWGLTRKSPYVYPQYNSDLRVAEKLVSSLYPWAEVRKVPIVLLRHNGMPLRKGN